MNRQHFAFEKSITLNVTNETLKDREILVKWYLRNAKAEILEAHEEKISEGSVIFSYPKYFKYQNPNLRYKVERDTITVQADAYAKSVEILDGNEDMVLSDNYFDLHGDSRTVKVLRGVPENIRVRSVYDIR